MELARFYALVARRIMLGMTPAQTRANGLGNPSLPQLWLTAMLRMLVVLVRNVVSTFQMRSFPLKRDWHTRDDEAPLPRVKTDTFKEPKTVPQDGPLTAVSYTSPSPSVSLAAQAIHLPLLRRWRTRHEGKSSTAAGGGGGSPRLRGETEGGKPHSQRKRTRGTRPRRRPGSSPRHKAREAHKSLRAKSGPQPSPGMRVEQTRQQALI